MSLKFSSVLLSHVDACHSTKRLNLFVQMLRWGTHMLAPGLKATDDDEAPFWTAFRCLSVNPAQPLNAGTACLDKFNTAVRVNGRSFVVVPV